MFFPRFTPWVFRTFRSISEHFKTFLFFALCINATFAEIANEMKLNKIVDDIAKDPKKGLIWAVLILIIMIAVYYAWKKLAAIWADVKTSIDNTLDNPVESGNLTHEAVWYKNAAESLFTAMDGLGTDWGTIERIIISVQNQDDWNKLVREYGTRTLSRFLQSDLTGTLQVHLKDDCSQSEISWISNYLRLVKNTNAGL